MNKPALNMVVSRIKPWHALAVLVLFNLVIALFIGRDFGEGWDETMYYLYGERSLDAYARGIAGLPLIPSKHIFFSDLRYYGPFYAALGKLTVDLLTNTLMNWSYEETWHLVNFGFFQGGLVCFYVLARRFVSGWTAFVVTLLLGTQPLIFGHAFINPKDIPFMTFFLASVASGFIMLEAGAGKMETNLIHQAIDRNYPYKVIAAILFALFVFTIVGKDLIASWIGSAVSFVYFADPESILGGFFSLFAEKASQLPVESYIRKTVNGRFEQILILVISLFVTGKWMLEEYKWRKKRGSVSDSTFRIDLKFTLKLIIAGIILGAATSIRLLAPFAGLLVAVYTFAETGKKSIPPLICYFSIAALTTYLAWPFLWDSPTYHFFESLRVMQAFPFGGTVKFMGNAYSPSSLPWIYIPALMLFQITEPVILLFGIGFAASIWNFVKHPAGNIKLLILYSWFIIPIGMFILLRSNAYDNFRQFFFVLPPIFILAGRALEVLYRRINHTAANLALTILFVLPGVLGISSLHPYEYIYYNSLVGGVRGAAADFETDYWLTSYREATAYLNTNAPLNAKILVFGNTFNVDHNARKDLRIYGFDSENAIQGTYDYALISTRYNAHLTILPDAEIVYEVRKNGELLCVIKKIIKP